MSTFWIALGLSLLGGLGGLLIASGVLLIHDSLRARLIPWLVSYAVGALLGISMMGLLPESLNELPAAQVFGTLLGGIMPRPTLFLIDGSSQMYRAYHAFRGRGLSNQEGHTTHAVYVFVTMLRKLIADHKPAYMAASFDLAGPTFRDEIVEDYKANRLAMPDDLAEQINWVHQACEAMGVPIVTAQGYEADDVIGTIAQRAASHGFEVAIVSIDKDFFQLVHGGDLQTAARRIRRKGIPDARGAAAARADCAGAAEAGWRGTLEIACGPRRLSTPVR